MNNPNYEILELQDDAKPADIKRAYLKLSHRYHPDRPLADPVMYNEIRKAYDALMPENVFIFEDEDEYIKGGMGRFARDFSKIKTRKHRRKSGGKRKKTNNKKKCRSYSINSK